MAARNVILSIENPSTGESLSKQLRHPVTLIGSKPGCRIRLQSPRVSSVHCAIVRVGSQVIVRDLASKDGTRVNDSHVETRVLEHGDRIQIRGWEFAIGFSDAESDDVEPIEVDLLPIDMLTLWREGGRCIQDSQHPVVLLGRDRRCDIPLETPTVSRAHALLLRQPSGLAVVDLLSANGTWVHDEPISTLRGLHEGDELRLGSLPSASRLRVAEPTRTIVPVPAFPSDLLLPAPPETSGDPHIDAADSHVPVREERGQAESGDPQPDASPTNGEEDRLRSRVLELESQSASLVAMQKKLDAQAKEAADVQHRLEQREIDLVAREAGACSAQRAADNQAAQLDIQGERIAEQRAETEAYRVALHSREEAVMDREHANRSRENDLTEIHRRHDARQLLLANQQAALEEREAFVAAECAASDDRLRRVMFRRWQLAERETKIAQAEADVSVRQEATHSIIQELEHRENQLSGREARSKQQRARLADVYQTARGRSRAASHALAREKAVVKDAAMAIKVEREALCERSQRIGEGERQIKHQRERLAKVIRAMRAERDETVHQFEERRGSIQAEASALATVREATRQEQETSEQHRRHLDHQRSRLAGLLRTTRARRLMAGQSVAKRQLELKAVAEALSAQRTDVQTSKETVQRQAAQLRHRMQEADAALSETRSHRAQVVAREAKITQREDTLLAREAKLEEESAGAREQIEQAAANRETIRASQQALDDRHAELEEQAKSLVEREGDLASREVAQRDSEAVVAELLAGFDRWQQELDGTKRLLERRETAFTRKLCRFTDLTNGIVPPSRKPDEGDQSADMHAVRSSLMASLPHG